MKAKDKVKMCPFCEGTVSLDATECRYCGSAFSRPARTNGSPYQTEDSLASLYEPPYAPRRGTFSRAPTIDLSEEIEEEEEEPVVRPRGRAKAIAEPAPAVEENEEKERSQIGSLVLLSIGSQLFTLGWLLFFFSSHGRLTLEWKSRYWFIYLLLSLPCIYHGWKKR